MQASTASVLFAGRVKALPPKMAAVSETAGMMRDEAKTYVWGGPDKPAALAWSTGRAGR